MPDPGVPMTCPVDGAVLTMTERQCTEIDYCPTCRGVWLDRGELDKIIGRSGDRDDDDRRSRGVQPPPPQQQAYPPQQGYSAPFGYRKHENASIGSRICLTNSDGSARLHLPIAKN